MTSASIRRILLSLAVASVTPVAFAGQLTLPQTAPPPAGPQIVIGATVAQRQDAARALVPLLKDVKARAAPGPAVTPGSAPASPFTGMPSTLFTFSVSERTVPVEPRVLTAMSRLLDWNIGAPGRDDEARLFDQWLTELETRATVAVRFSGGTVCDVTCIVTRMTTLNDAWGPSPKGRADARDELLLDALKAAVAKDR